MSKRNRNRVGKLGGAIAALALCTGQVALAAKPDQLICGFENVEDMVAIPDTPWIIGSGIGDTFFQHGALHLINEDTNLVKKVSLDMPAGVAAQAPYDQCPGPVSSDAFSAHGLSITTNADGTHNLYVVNHGGREAIEVFKVTTGDDEPRFDWLGCVPTPETATSNSVAARPDGSLLMSASAAVDFPIPPFAERAQSGEDLSNMDLSKLESDPELAKMQYGAIFAWNRQDGWSKVPGSVLKGNNGIELSKDGNWAFENSWPGASVTRIPLDPALGEVREAKLGFNPDNIRWSYDGKLVATGHVAEVSEVARCVLTSAPDCKIDYRVAEVDPETLEVTQLFDGTATPYFGMATIGLKTAKALWIGSVRSDCIARVVLPARD